MNADLPSDIPFELRPTSRYEVYCSNRKWRNRVVAHDLSWPDADRLRNALNARHEQRRPDLTCWTRRHYCIRLISPTRSAPLLKSEITTP